MKTIDALNILGLTPDCTVDMIKQAYREAAIKYHPDKNPAGVEMMQAVNAAYETLKSYEFKQSFEDEIDIEYGSALYDVLKRVVPLDGLTIEICGAWVWISGETKTHKATLKESGCQWARQKKQWYFRPAKYKSRNRKCWDMSKIRDTYGAKTVKTANDTSNTRRELAII